LAAVEHKWQPLAQGRLKCNIDTAFSEQFRRTCIGLFLWNDFGTFVLAKMLQFDSIYPVEVGESLGLFHALEWINDMQFDNIDFVLDFKTTTDAFNTHRIDISELGSIIDACWNLFATSFTISRVEFSRRQANVAAHALAREATSIASPVIY